jgi:D-alanine-D-alanine ligase
MDKHRAKERFLACGVPTPAWELWPVDGASVEALGWPIVVKPSKVGSTVGLTVVDRFDDLDGAAAEASRFDDQVLLEQFVGGREFTVGILGTRALAVGEIIPSHAIFDYECKYTPGMTEEIFPARIPDDLAAHMRTLALRAHDALELRDFSRVDFRLGADDIPYCLEVNTLPGLTATSLLPQSALAEGIGFPALCDEICRLGLERARNKGPAGGM